tara:strand:- start:14187 stop:15035 length:849 start_codon:yes stop_codon:yes gene_type:complete
VIDPTLIDYVIYHKNCADGFGAAWAAWKLIGNQAEYVPASYGAPSPDVTGKNVAILDFSYDKETIKYMTNCAETLVVIDHHISAKRELANLPNAIFDMNYSGAQLAWDFFHPNKPTPVLIEYIQDRDLWKWKMPHSKAFCAALDTVPMKFEEYDKMLDPTRIDTMINEGASILANNDAIIGKILKNAYHCKFEGYDAMVINSPWWMSEMGSRMAQECAIAIIWYYNHKRDFYKFSLRTRRDDIDVSVIAGKFGGGGHAKAAGFAIEGDDMTEMQFMFKKRVG